jgi:hypothetical protein
MAGPERALTAFVCYVKGAWVEVERKRWPSISNELARLARAPNWFSRASYSEPGRFCRAWDTNEEHARAETYLVLQRYPCTADADGAWYWSGGEPRCHSALPSLAHLCAFRLERYAALRALQLHQCVLGAFLVQGRICVCRLAAPCRCYLCVSGGRRRHPHACTPRAGRAVLCLPHEICERIARYEARSAIAFLPAPQGVLWDGRYGALV